MNFIEKLFGVSPDGGSGLLEWPLLLTLAFMAIALLRLATLWRKAPPGYRIAPSIKRIG